MPGLSLLRVVTLLLTASPAGTRAAAPARILFSGGTIVDGTGAPARVGDIRVVDGRIVAIGDRLAPEPADRVVSATGLVVCPGFIDLHTHSDTSIVQDRTRSNFNYQTQGVTTIVTGNCGLGTLDTATYFAKIDAAGAGANVVHLIPHNQLREKVLGRGDLQPTPSQLETMKRIVDQQMAAGAWGLSTGLIYQPGVFAKTPEIIALARVAAARGGIYASHIRDEGAGLLRSVDETLSIGREAGIPVHISHFKATGRKNWGLTDPAAGKIRDARKAGMTVTADQYPYVASSTRLTAMVVPAWASQGTAADFAKLLEDPVKGPKLRREILQDLESRNGGASIRIARYAKKPEYVGKDLAAIAKSENRPVLDVVLDIERAGSAAAISFGMSEDDVRSVMTHDFVATASDGGGHAPGGGDKPHPRAYGTFPRKIRYALDDKIISLEAAIRSSSGLPARILGLADRGTLKVGSHADVLVFDPKTFRDASTFDDPTRYAPGVKYLLINGTAVIDEGKPVPVLPGRALRLKADGAATTILNVGRIWTGDDAKPWAESVAVRDGLIAAVGSKAEIEAFRGPKTETIELPTAFATPGLIDAHTHLISLGEGLEEVELRGVKSLDEVARLVKERIAATPGDTWITGSHWDQSLWPGGEFPTKAVLDAVAPDRPVWLTRVDGHAGWANSEALRRAGVTAASKAPSDGRILLDAGGNPTGVFIDGAMGLVTKAIPGATNDQIRRRILAGQRVVLESGLTGIHDAGISPREAEIYRELDRDGRIRVRIYGMANPPGGREVEFVKTPPAAVKDGRRFELRAIKLFADGAMGSRGGLLFEPYADDPKTSGLALIEPEVLRATTIEAFKNGWQVCTHAIGDKGNAVVLDAYEAALKAVPTATDARPRIEHAQVVRRADVPRFAKLGVIASMQPSHSSDDMRWADARLGPERVAGAYAWRWFLDEKVTLAFGSDFPVAVVSPFYGIYCALTRQDEEGKPAGGWHPDQRLTLEETLRAFTATAARAAFMENEVGVLKPGFKADLTIVDRDLFKTAPAEILKTRVVMTIVDGRVEYKRP